MTSKIVHTDFTEEQKDLIRRLLEIQMTSLLDCMNGESEQDLELYCLQNNLSIEYMRDNLYREYLAYKAVHKNPNSLMTLSTEQQSVFRHLLYNNLRKKKYTALKSTLWAKFSTLDRFDFNLN